MTGDFPTGDGTAGDGAADRAVPQIFDPAMNYINGARVIGAGETFAVLDPCSGNTVVEFPLATESQVHEAVSVARRAFGTWSQTTPGERSALMHALAATLEKKAFELAAVESIQTGKPHKLASGFDVPGTIDNTAFFAGAARVLEGTASGEYSADHTSIIRREPIGVIGSIAPWNYPLQMAGWKILPAIAAGNTIVLKPSEITPLTALLLAEAATEAGIPDGVVNVVTGTGLQAGNALTGHPEVDMVSFTGSTAVGRAVMATCASRSARVHLELGGKAPFVVFEDADLEAAIHGAVAGSLINTGQDCTAATRAYVHSSRIHDFIEGVADLFASITLGAPFDPGTDLGPLSSARHRDHVAGFVSRARQAGGRIYDGGTLPGAEWKDGFWHRPILIAGLDQKAEAVQQEIFGPVLTVLPFDTDDEALTLANDSPFGLAASAWTSDVHRALRASREIKAGTVWINDHIPIFSEMPHGGYGASGFGKDMSVYSLHEYTQIKHVAMDLTRKAEKDWHRTIFKLPAS